VLPGATTDLIGFGAVATALALQWWRRRQPD
jgi:hypothetical protein